MKVFQAFLTAVCFIALPGTVQASSIQVNWGSVTGGGVEIGGYDLGTVYAGQAKLTVVGSLNTPVGVLPDGYSFESYCIDLLRYAGDDTYSVDEVRLMSQWHEPGYLYPAVPEPSTDYPFVTNLTGRNAAAWLYQTMGPAAVAPEQQAALAVAMWEVLYEKTAGAYGLSDGYVKFYGGFDGNGPAGSVGNIAAGYLNAIPQNPAGSDALWIVTHDSGTGLRTYTQDFIAPIPEPSTLILLGGGLVLLAGAGFRKRND